MITKKLDITGINNCHYTFSNATVFSLLNVFIQMMKSFLTFSPGNRWPLCGTIKMIQGRNGGLWGGAVYKKRYF